MYTEMQEQLRMSLAHFFGSILVNSNFKDPNLKRQSLVALVIEELLKICKTEDGQIDIVASKPIIRGANYLLENRMNNIVDQLRSTSLNEEEIEEATKDLYDIVSSLNKYLETTK